MTLIVVSSQWPEMREREVARVARNEGHMEECNQQLHATRPIGRARHKRSMRERIVGGDDTLIEFRMNPSSNP